MLADAVWHARLTPLIGHDGLQKLSQAKVIVFGCGGVGSYAIEALIRSGIGTLIIVDGDVVATTNLNRQIPALHSTLGQRKVDVMAARCRDIQPSAHIISVPEYYNEQTRETFWEEPFPDFVLDAIDTLTWKVDILKTGYEKGVRVLTSTGMGNRLHPEFVTLTTLDKTAYDPLARHLRRALSLEGIPLNDVPCVFSKEHPLKRSGHRTPTSSAFVPATAGLIAAGYIVRHILEE